MNKNERYKERKAANEKSRNHADHDREQWDEAEISLLESCWGDVPLSEIAEALGRTIEACRQRHYELGKAKVVRAKEVKAKARRAVDVWTTGFTSLDDMDRYFDAR